MYSESCDFRRVTIEASRSRFAGTLVHKLLCNGSDCCVQLTSAAMVLQGIKIYMAGIAGSSAI